jgi:outer membrane protein TolC
MEPIFNKGQNKARLKRTKAKQKQSLYDLRSTILKAGQEVTNALSQFKHAQRKLKYSKKQLTALKKAVKFSRELLRNGPANFTQVLQAQQALLAAQLNHVNDRLQELTAGVKLYQALGGGWKNWEGVAKGSSARADTVIHKN